MRAPHDLFISGGDTEMSSLVLLTRLGFLADVSCMQIKTNSDGLIMLSEAELASFRYSKEVLNSVGIIPQITTSSYMNRLDGKRVLIYNNESIQMVRALSTMTCEDYASAQQH